MMLNNDVLSLHRNRHKYSPDEYLISYSKLCNQVLYLDIPTIIDITDHLTESTIQHSLQCAKYLEHTGIISKSDLDSFSGWTVPGYKSFDNRTGGSTTNIPFTYKIWSDTYQTIENNSHYGLICDEFAIRSNPIILYLMFDRTVNFASTEFVKIHNTNGVIMSHGRGAAATVHEICANREYHSNYYEFYEKVINYSAQIGAEIILAPSHVVAALAWNVKRLGINTRLCKLLSQTGNKVDIADLEYLRTAGAIDNWCDHMRCWDGGATFFTCRYNTYHLCDNLAWTDSINSKLISYDYFSRPTPFVNYWNGDYASIGESYQYCKCGRAYREFKIGRTRNFAVNMINDAGLRDKLESVQGFVDNIKRVEFFDDLARIFCRRRLDQEEQQELKLMFNQFKVSYIIESDG